MLADVSLHRLGRIISVLIRLDFRYIPCFLTDTGYSQRDKARAEGGYRCSHSALPPGVATVLRLPTTPRVGRDGESRSELPEEEAPA